MKRPQAPPLTASSSDISDAPEESLTIVHAGRSSSSSSRRSGKRPVQKSMTEVKNDRSISPSRSSPLSDLAGIESPLSSISSPPPALPAVAEPGPLQPSNGSMHRASRRAAAKTGLAAADSHDGAVSERPSRRATKKRRLSNSSSQATARASLKTLEEPMVALEEQTKLRAPSTRSRNPSKGNITEAPTKVSPASNLSEHVTGPAPLDIDERWALGDQDLEEPQVQERIHAFHGSNNAGQAMKGWQDPYPVGELGA